MSPTHTRTPTPALAPAAIQKGIWDLSGLSNSEDKEEDEETLAQRVAKKAKPTPVMEGTTSFISKVKDVVDSP